MGFCLSSYAQLNTDRIIAIGRNALYFEDYVLSIQYFNQVIKVKPYLAEPYLYRAIAKIQLSDYNGAEHDCEMAIRNNPFMPGAYYTRGFIYRQTGQLEKAEEDFTHALLFSPENKTYLLLRSDVRAQQHKLDEALDDINFLISKDPRSAQLHFEKGLFMLEKKDTVQALDCFTKTTELDSQNSTNWSARGHINMLLGNNDEALLDLTKAINLGSRWAGDYVNRGIILYRNHNYRGALADYDKAVEYNPKDPNCYYNRGLLRQELGDLNRALDDFNKTITLDPNKTEVYYQVGMVNMQLNQWKEAINAFDTLINHYPYFLPSYFLASQAAVALGRTTDAYKYQRKGQELEKQKESIQKRLRKEQETAPNTDVQIASSQPQKKDNRKEFSSRAAQDSKDNTEDRKYETESRGSVQKKHSDVINEPMIQLSYYSKPQTLRRTNYFYYRIDEYNKQRLLPSPLHFTVQEVPLTAELINKHFKSIDNISDKIDNIITIGMTHKDSIDASNLYFARAMEFALVQDYTSAIDDCTKAITFNTNFAIAFFCRANWRLKQRDYQINNHDDSTPINTEEEMMEYKYGRSMILRDYDQVIRLWPDFAFAYYNKANVLCEQKAFKEAIENYNKAIEIDHDFAEAWFNRGLTRVFIEQTDDGLMDLSKSGELGIYQAYNLITRFQ